MDKAAYPKPTSDHKLWLQQTIIFIIDWSVDYLKGSLISCLVKAEK